TTLPYLVINLTTIEKLELLCLKFSITNKEYLYILIRERTIFPTIHDKDTRNALLYNISNIPMLIPLLRTFFETLKYLEPIYDIFKQLISNKLKGTI
ncbi:hypothetical protein CC80DRAFT_424765, partial [Byssothecium circinans]